MSSNFIEKKEEIVGQLESLHKFCKLTKYTRNCLTNNSVWFSKLEDFNDPFEGMVNYAPLSNAELIFSNEFMFPFNVPDEAEIRLREFFYRDERAFFSHYEKVYSLWYEDLLNKSRKKGYHCLFSTRKDRHGKTPEEDMLMWGHYTNGMRGFRINYHPDVLLNGIGEEVDGYFIKYIDEPQTVGLDQLFYDLCRSPSAGRYITVHDENLFHTKSEHWSYEAELRLRQESPGLRPCPKNSIKSIDFGCRMSLRQIKEVQILVKRNHPDVRFYKAVPSKKAFKIELLPQRELFK